MPITCVSFDETNQGRVGVWMTDVLKRSLAGEMQRSLADGQLCFAEDFVSTRRDKNLVGRLGVQHEFLEQLSEFREELIEPNDLAVGTYKKICTGKGGGRKDDILICSMLALYFGLKQRLRPEFRALGEQLG
jgi:hypothetical protein